MGGCGARMEISRNLGMGSGRAAGRCPVVGLTAATKSAPGLLGPGASGSLLLTLSLCVLGWDSGLEFEAIGSVVAATLPNPPPPKKSHSPLQKQWICDPGYVQAMALAGAFSGDKDGLSCFPVT